MKIVVLDLVSGMAWYENGAFGRVREKVRMAEGGWVVDRGPLLKRLALSRWLLETPLVSLELSGGRRDWADDVSPLVLLADPRMDALQERVERGVEVASPVGFAAYWNGKGARVGRKVKGELLWADDSKAPGWTPGEGEA